MSITHLNDSVAYSSRVGAIYSPAGYPQRGTDPWTGVNPFPGQSYTRLNGGGSEIDIAPWGANNLQPMHLLQLMAENNVAPGLLNTQVNFAVGERHFLYVEDLRYDEITDTFVVQKVPYQSEAVDNFLRQLDGGHPGKYFRKAATDYYFSGNVFSRMVLSRNPERFGIAFIDHIDSSQVRLERMRNGRIDRAYISDNWMAPKYDPSNRAESNTVRYRMWRENDPLKYYRSIYHSKIYHPGQPYYGRQPWHSATTWIGFANRIPVWMNSNIDNSYNIKYHIIYPEYYFDYTKNMSAEDAQKERDRVFDQFDLWLAGKENVNKTFFSKGKVDKLTGKLMDSWRIEPIKADVQDRAWLDAYRTSQGALTAGFDINPSLANVPNEGKFSTSGSEQRIAYQLHIALKVQAARAAMVEPVEKAIRINARLGVPGFENPDVKIGFINKNVVTLADSPSGMSSTDPNEPA